MSVLSHDLDALAEAYKSLESPVPWAGPDQIRSDLLITIPLAGEATRAIVPGRHRIRITTDEFTAVCPWTGLPDFGEVVLEYTPGEKIVELKSLKYYLLSFRNVGIIQEQVAERIADDLYRVLEPVSLTLRLDYKPRGGIHTLCEVTRP